MFLDWVMDLQYVPQPLDRVGELCGFDGNGHHCHKGLVPVFGIFPFAVLLFCLTHANIPTHQSADEMQVDVQ
jgi:hypothetical protein